MVRNAQVSPSDSVRKAADNSLPLPAFNLHDGGMGAVRDWLNGSLVAAQNLAAWLEQSQKLNAQAVNTWHENLSVAMREAEQADDLQKLMGVTTQLVNRQMGSAIEQFGAGVRQAIETEAQWMEHLRNTTVSASQQMLKTGVPVPSDASANGLPLSQLGHAQAEWLAMTQRWIDNIKLAGSHHR